MAPKGKALAVTASLRSSGTAVEPSRQLDDPQDEAIHLALLESPKIAATSSESNASRRSRAKANSKLQDQLRTQAAEIAELKALILQQTGRQTDRTQSIPTVLTERAHGKRLEGNTTYHEPDQPYESVEDVGHGPEVTRPDVRRLDPRITPQRSAESDITDLGRHRKPRIQDPKKLSDGTDPTWISWQIGTINKLEQDSFQFDTEKSKIAYVFGSTEGLANKLLTPRMKPNCATPFTSVEEMFQLLSDLFTDPAEREQAVEDFRDLVMTRS